MIQTALFLIILVLAVALVIFVKLIKNAYSDMLALIHQRDELVLSEAKARSEKQLYQCEADRFKHFLQVQNEASRKLREENDRLRQLVTRVRPVPNRIEINAQDIGSNVDHISDAWRRFIRTSVATGIIKNQLIGL